ncbi:DNA (cytosine-5)-methyltransferase DRM1 [Linum grandiflorum]
MSQEIDEFEWDSDIERQIEEYDDEPSTSKTIVDRTGQVVPLVGASGTKVTDQFIEMGFSAKEVAEAIREAGEENADLILSTLLTHRTIQNDAQEQPDVGSDLLSSDFDGSFLDDFSDFDDDAQSEVNVKVEADDDHDDMFTSLASMGYTPVEVSIAMERCGPDATAAELTDFIFAAQMAKEADALYPVEERKPKPLDTKLKRSNANGGLPARKKPRMSSVEDDEIIRLPVPMIGFGTPTSTSPVTSRIIPEAGVAPPYFYYENVALAPKGVWQVISRFLFEIEPEFVDSKYFCAAARKRGYVHNLPIEGRFPLRPLPPQTIHEALPMTKRNWPKWDTRDKLNCLQTAIGSAKLTERIRQALENYDENTPPPLNIQKWVMYECKKWNLVWVGKNKVAPLEPDEVEMLLGFPRNHTRGGGISRTDRYKSLGNSFQVDTVAYHLSVLKQKFPNGLNVLSLFSGIGGAEVALYKLGIRMNNVVSVEISRANRDIMKSWWEQTNQKGSLIEIDDVQKVTTERLEDLMSMVGGFDLVVGGSPCNNLAGSNRHHRNGLEGEHSSLFYDYIRILEAVKTLYDRYRR